MNANMTLPSFMTFFNILCRKCQKNLALYMGHKSAKEVREQCANKNDNDYDWDVDRYFYNPYVIDEAPICDSCEDKINEIWNKQEESYMRSQIGKRVSIDSTMGTQNGWMSLTGEGVITDVWSDLYIIKLDNGDDCKMKEHEITIIETPMQRIKEKLTK